MQSLFDIGISKENLIDILDHKQSYVNVNSITVDSDVIDTGTFMIRRGNTIATISIEIKLDANELCEILRISNLKQRLLRE
jgi:hypothetical protein